ncbi:anthranilate phosphoribosyltransferase [Kitasatospora sp. MAA4]|uniref:anthranilate phosphoribosyltransferase n=1 Tax=Kitasatospora sp. MAA4 TaxID=3035093 RepID=UPI0024745577|nr:anthranilate phosphoribosyltransferase [Kitasatospora sp. MAA4]MDH6131732.1 anthranilate phosphoribosyltransferase [Kitasatospora sp. MAA4]
MSALLPAPARPPITTALHRLACGHDLTRSEAQSAMSAILDGSASPVQIAGFAMALSVKGARVEELVGLVSTARAFGLPLPGDGQVLDTCGTGGDGRGTFNISTSAAIVAAACGVPVAKHGNRSASSACGSADVLEELGVRIDLGPEQAASCLERTGITFLFAPVFQESFRYAAGTRRELGVRTVFNLLGPLCNPARARFQVLGVFDPAMVPVMAEVLHLLGTERALVFHAEDGLDELSIGAPTQVVELHQGRRRAYRLDPAALGIAPGRPADLDGGGPAENADIVRRLLAGEKGPRRDIVLLNTAAALRAAGRTEDWHEGMALAADALDTGRAAWLLDQWIAVSHEVTEPTPTLT